MNINAKTLSILAVAFMVFGCDQQDVTFPDDLAGSGDRCGPWYAGGSAEDGAQPTVYALAEDATFPCYLWTSVRQDLKDTRLNVGELYLDSAEGKEDRRALIMLISGAKCPSCAELISGLTEFKDELDELALMLAVNSGEPALDIVYDLDEAWEVLVEEEGWPNDWYVTNDVENYIVGYQSYPWLVIVRLSDMVVIKHSNAEFGKGNIPDLIDLLETF